MSARATSYADGYADGYAEGRRTGLHLVCALGESTVLQAARTNSTRDNFGTFRAYWLGFARGCRNHYADAYRPTVLAARARRVSA